MYVLHRTPVRLVSNGDFGSWWIFRTELTTGTRARSCTMGSLLHVPLGDEWAVFGMMTEAEIRKKDAVHRREVRSSEE